MPAWNLFELVIELLESRKLLDKVIALQAQKGNDAASPRSRAFSTKKSWHSESSLNTAR
jgi:hypothetical protein